VVAPDLRGYGASRAPAGGPYGEGFSKREMARELVKIMSALGHERFAVVGHDRGARVAYRLALDHPGRVARVAILNAVPTIEQFERMGAGPSLGFWPWFLLAQPAPFPERLLEADPGGVLNHVFATWSGDPEAITAEARETYRRAFDPPTIAAICGDYRASFHVDRGHDAADREAGRRITAPLLVVIGADETQLADAPDIWGAWADDVAIAELPGGHFLRGGSRRARRRARRVSRRRSRRRCLEVGVAPVELDESAARRGARGDWRAVHPEPRASGLPSNSSPVTTL
jgi:haloacetate dehalogenase